ncbi:Hypothetical Protein FCC1311_112642 [Hondaea fermentalgiana]|uniref:Uncharacterized protein n=1 Tax=Hondaea fermentalgiana TaxID=2315210 RepID=A0A2R5H2H2_9STRA|nr:Hypothetical Protein FCC1311_112642 [Hondaea fermentalgiana]|eukprot:GBG35041.1 Hypothetical Protein FCC1311_112642 [Hondaea fermentalgiana]
MVVIINTATIDGGTPSLVLSQPGLGRPLVGVRNRREIRRVENVIEDVAVFREIMDDAARFLDAMSEARSRPASGRDGNNRHVFLQPERAPRPPAGPPPLAGVLNIANAPGGAQPQAVDAAPEAHQEVNNAAGAAPEANQVEHDNAAGAAPAVNQAENNNVDEAGGVAAGVAVDPNVPGDAETSDEDGESLHSEARSVDEQPNPSDEEFIDNSGEDGEGSGGDSGDSDKRGHGDDDPGDRPGAKRARATSGPEYRMAMYDRRIGEIRVRTLWPATFDLIPDDHPLLQVYLHNKGLLNMYKSQLEQAVPQPAPQQQGQA